ncbi:2-hydroxychromene-2-carboxylate isomerase [Brevundimonas sp. AJA228-03]|uniref:2-hydroxychromene-2-carboxylate isomerase n=1 Tax=Brevundimonas sp. AJA228-03 TaxID=2752515 RepID=UPI001ADFED7C|nr:2-hydroxychromene-2-carboxylate isomerase [Brevundimonas sp. AJA228-03]QTN20385.1 2-hydroxychromene-2-carboxylate isomerase [Brevundimonas sp. AJA228-03]
MTKTVDFIFDFASPNGYFALKALRGVTERTGARINLIPCLLGGLFKATGNQAPMVAFGGIKGKMDYEMLEIRRFIARHALTAFRMNPHFPINSLLAMRGLCAVEGSPDFEPYVEAVSAGFWEQSLAMGDPAVLASVLTGAGLDAEAILTAAQTDPVKARLADNTAAAVERGAFGVPTFFVGDEMFFGKERLGQVEELLTQEPV